MHDPVTELFAEDKRALNEDKAEEAWKERILLQSISNLMETPDGKTFMWWLFDQTHYFQPSMTGNSWTYFREGERNIGNKILEKLLTVRPGAIQELIEHRNKQQEKSDD